MFKILETIPKVIAWLRIFISPFLIGLITGWVIYLKYDNLSGQIVAISIALLGMILGVLWAENVRKKTGTVEFVSRLHATRELDNLNKKKN